MRSSESATAQRSTADLSWLRDLSFNDWLAFAYLVGLNLAWLGAEPSAHRDRAGPWVLGLLLAFLLLSVLVGRALRVPMWLRAFGYRAGLFGSLQLSYFALGELLPAVSPHSFDQELYQLDLWLFGTEPALWLDAFVTPATTEWFSFFYYSYFFLLAAHIFPILFWGRDLRVVAEFGLGMTVIVALGQSCYMLVPGLGPYDLLRNSFQNELPPGLWWDLVTDLVEHGGAKKDIFPSLHTALPSYVTMFSYQHRALVPYRFTWPIVGFIALNIMIATMFLRWHYLIDVVAGLLLAVTALVASHRLTTWESARRAARGLGPSWPAWSRADDRND